MRLVERGGLSLLVSPVLEATGILCAHSVKPLSVRSEEGRRRLVEAMGLDPGRLVSPNQVHSATVVEVGITTGTEPLEADALVTREPGRPLLLRAADCSLVVVSDPVHRAAGAAHAGWRGSARGILIQMLKLMNALYGTRPRECSALVGPTISQARYPVGPEVPAAFLRSRSWASAHVAARGGQLFFDLAAANAHFLLECGIPRASLEVAPYCTSADAEMFFSYRRDGAGCGHHGVVVALPS